MKIVYAIVATVLVGLVAFQNCQQAPHPDDMSAAAGALSSGHQVDLQSEKISDISFNFQEVETVARTNGTYQVSVDKSLKVLLPSGQMELTSDLTAGKVKYCLTETLNTELTSILKSSQVCAVSPANTGQVCTQVFKLPYAVVTTEKATYSLGSASDGCGNNSIDLCGDQSSLLKGFMATLKANYKNLICQ